MNDDRLFFAWNPVCRSGFAVPIVVVDSTSEVETPKITLEGSGN